MGDLIRCAGRAQERPFGAVTPLERRDEYYALFVFVGGAVAVCFEGCCGSMCWPRERPATHAAAGAAARGVRGDWGILLRLDWEPLRGHGLTTGVVRHACRHRVTARGVFGLGDSFTQIGGIESAARGDHRSGHSAPCRHRVTARGLRRFGFWGWGFFHTLRRDGTRGFFVWGDYFAVLWGALSPFVLRVVAGACVGRRRACERIPGGKNITVKNIRNLRRQAAHPTGVAAALSRSDCTGGTLWRRCWVCFGGCCGRGG